MTRLKAEYCHHGHPHQCYGVIWECQNCHKTYCCIEGTDTDQICDRCWSEENPEEAAAIGDQLEGTESASVYEFHAKTFVTDSIKLDVGIKPSDSTGRQDNQPFVGIHGHDLNQIIKFKLTDVLFGFDLVAVTPPLRDAMETLRALSEVEEPGYDKEFAEHLAAARLLITDIFKLPPDEEQVQATIANMNIGGTNDHTE